MEKSLKLQQLEFALLHFSNNLCGFHFVTGCYNMSYFFNNLFLQTFADVHSIPFLETSAKHNENVEEAFFTMVDLIMKTQQAEPPTEEKPIRITPLKPQEQKKKRCC